MDIHERVADLQSRIEGAQRERLRAEGARDAAQHFAEKAAEELQRDFGITTAQSAQAALDALRAELEAITAEISAALDEAGV